MNLNKRNWEQPLEWIFKLVLVAGISIAHNTLGQSETWTARDTGQRAWKSVASSDDGRTVVAVVDGSHIHMSMDSATSWVQKTGSGQRQWEDVTLSSNGAALAAVVNGGGYIYTSSDGGDTWVERADAGNRFWSSIAGSSDGSHLAAASYGGYIYTSTDGGESWIERDGAGALAWWTIASSSDGNKLAACVLGGEVYTSADGGANWTQQSASGKRNWSAISSSSDGTRLIAVVSNGGGVFTSSDSGVSWTERSGAGQRNWSDVSSSSDGSILVATVKDGSIYVSKDSGASWLEQLNAGQRSWGGVSCSADGTKMVAVDEGGFVFANYGEFLPVVSVAPIFQEEPFIKVINSGPRLVTSITSSPDGIRLAAAAINGYIYTSDDAGETWIKSGSPGHTYWNSIASSSDGVRLAAAAGLIYTSDDAGETWIQRTSAGQRPWASITSSSDGIRLAAAAMNSYIYTSVDAGETWVQRTSAGSREWKSITSSSDGIRLAAAEIGSIYTSDDAGETWVESTSAGKRSWESITSSSDGIRLAAAELDGGIYTSIDAGETWVQRTSAGSRFLRSITSSSDGTRLAAVSGNYFTIGHIYTSDDAGETWIQRINYIGTGEYKYWGSVSGSFDLEKLVTMTREGLVYYLSRNYFEYSSKPHHLIESSLVGLIGQPEASGSISYIYTGIKETTYGPSNIPPTEIGDYEVVAVSAADTFYKSTTSEPYSYQIIPKSIQGTFSVVNKLYDGTTEASIKSRELNGAIEGHDISLTGGTATFADKNAGVDKTVSLTGATLSGADADKYILKGINTSIATIQPRELTGTLTVSNKTYDGTTAATVTDQTLNNVVAGETLSLSGGVAGFEDKNAGTGKRALLTGATLTGNTSSNYALGEVSGVADISKKATLPTITAEDKVYDGAGDVELITSLLGTIAGDDVTLIPDGTPHVLDLTIGTDKTVIVPGGFVLTGVDAGNYSLGPIPAITVDVIAQEVFGTFTVSNKTYDGTSEASVLSLGLQIAGGQAVVDSELSLTGGTAAFSDASAGVGKTVTLSGATLSGANVGNYILKSLNTTTADINPISLTGSFTAANKEYNGTPITTVQTRSLSGVLAGETVSLVGGEASFEDKTVGVDRAVTLTGAGLEGVDAGNYALGFVSPTAANITAKELAGNFTAEDKSADGTADATVLTRTLEGVIEGDTVELTGGNASFDNPTVGDGKVVTLNGATLTGADSPNYTLSGVNPASASILANPLSIIFTAEDKTYDGGSLATVTETQLLGVIEGDDVRLTGGSATFEDSNAGLDKKVTLAGYEIQGADLGKYSLPEGPITSTATITPKSLTGSFTAADKTYDATSSASASDLSLSGVLDGDSVELEGGSASFADALAGQGKTVTLSGATLTGADVANYTLSSVSETTANIDAKSVTGSFTVSSKLFDGTSDATVLSRSLSGVIEGDEVELSGGLASFLDAAVGEDKTVSLSGAELSGSDAGNYILSEVNAAVASIFSNTLSVTFSVASKEYDGSASATIQSQELLGVNESDDVELTQGIAHFNDANVGEGKTVTLSEVSLIGADASRYVLDSDSLTTTADITAKALTIQVKDNYRVAGSADPSFNFEDFSSQLVAGDTIADVTGGNGEQSDVEIVTTADLNSDPGDYSIQITPSSLDGTKSGNYDITLEDGTLRVFPKLRIAYESDTNSGWLPSIQLLDAQGLPLATLLGNPIVGSLSQPLLVSGSVLQVQSDENGAAVFSDLELEKSVTDYVLRFGVGDQLNELQELRGFNGVSTTETVEVESSAPRDGVIYVGYSIDTNASDSIATYQVGNEPEIVLAEGEQSLNGAFSIRYIANSNVKFSVLNGSFEVTQFQFAPSVVDVERVFLMSGDLRSIEPVITEIPDANYQWYFNDEIISGQMGSLLELDMVTPAQAGMYRLEASHSEGQTVSKNILVTVGIGVDVSALGSGEVSIEPVDPYYVAGETLLLRAQSAENWVFDRWVGDISSDQNPLELTLEDNVNLTAEFLPTFTLDVAQTGTGEIVLTPDKERYVQGEVVEISAIAGSGWGFSSWEGDLNQSSNAFQLEMTENIALTGIFKPIRVLSWSALGEGSVTLEPEGPFLEGDLVSVRAVASTGWSFVGWQGDVGGSINPLELELDSDKELVAEFKPLYTVSVSVEGQGSVALSPEQAEYVGGSVVNVEALAAPGWSFAGWSGALSGSSLNSSLTVNENLILQAEFREVRNVLVSALGEGSVTLEPEGPYMNGDLVSVRAVASARWRFVGWQGDASGSSNPLALELDSDKELVAEFKPLFTVGVNPSEGGLIAVTPDLDDYLEGTPITVSAQALEGWRFTGWTGDLSGEVNPLDISVTESIEVGAVFTRERLLQVDSTPGGSVLTRPDQLVFLDGETVELEAVADPGFEFENWSDGLGSANPLSLLLNEDRRVSAVFSDIQRPTLTIVSPINQSTVNHGVQRLSGTVTDNSQMDSLSWSLNGSPRNTMNWAPNGAFESDPLLLVPGENRIDVLAVDLAGNRTEELIILNFDPIQLLSLTDVGSVQEGQRVSFELKLESAGNVGGITFNIEYDTEVWTDLEWRWERAVEIGVVSFNSEEAGLARGSVSLPGLTLQNGVTHLATLKLRAKSTPGTIQTELPLEIEDLADEAGAPIVNGNASLPGKATVTSRRIIGDNNANQRLDIGDATLVQRFLTGLEEMMFWDVLLNDVNKSNSIDSGDVIRILRTIVGLDAQPVASRALGSRALSSRQEVLGDEKALLLSSALSPQSGEIIQVQVNLEGLSGEVSGMSFRLDYPVEGIRLVGANGLRAGAMVPQNALKLWNVEPGQNDFANQTGVVFAAISSPERWQGLSGKVVELDFEVQPGFEDAEQWSLILSEIELVGDGFDIRQAATSELILRSAQPNFQSLSGVALDGYLFGSTVWWDANRNGKLDEGEPSTETSGIGAWELELDLTLYDLNQNGRLDLEEGRLSLAGGVDTSSGTAFVGHLIGSAEATVLSPVSTLMVELMETEQITASAASVILLSRLGLPDRPLENFDPIEAVKNQDPAAVEFQLVNAQLQDTADLILRQLLSSGDIEAAQTQEVAAQLTKIMVQKVASGGLNLQSGSTISEMIEALKQERSIPASDADAVVSALAAGQNEAKAQLISSEATPQENLQKLINAQALSRLETQPRLDDYLNQVLDETQLLNEQTGAAWIAQVDALPDVNLEGVNGSAGRFNFSQSESVIREGATIGSSNLWIVRDQGFNGEVTVKVELTQATGVNINQVLVTFQPAELRKELPITQWITDDGVYSGDRTVALTLSIESSAAAGAIVGDTSSVTLEIQEDEEPTVDGPAYLRWSANRQLQASGPTGASYSLESSQDLVQWEMIPALEILTEGADVWVDINTQITSPQFLRLRQIP